MNVKINFYYILYSLIKIEELLLIVNIMNFIKLKDLPLRILFLNLTFKIFHEFLFNYFEINFNFIFLFDLNKK